MKIVISRDYEGMSRQAANILSAQVIIKPNAVLGLATGSTPLGTYRQLIDWYRKGDLDFSEIRTINLDEYCGLEPSHEQSYRYFMESHFFSQINILPENTFLPDGTDPDEKHACKTYDAIIHRLGGVDLQLLGIGLDGHIGFNEPGNTFTMGTHCVKLTESTIDANKRFFGNDPEAVPKKAYTMGIRDIMQAHRIVLIANGESKAEIIHKAFAGPVTPAVPASILQMHPDFTLILDEAAGYRLRETLNAEI